MFYLNSTDEGVAGNLASAGPPIFRCSLEEVRELVCLSVERERAWLRFESFLLSAEVEKNFSHLHLMGPFVSGRGNAGGIDAALQTRSGYGPTTFGVLQPCFALGLREIQARYGARLRFWVEGAPSGLRFVRGYGAEGPTTRPAHLPELIRHGIVRVDLDSAGLYAAV